MWMTNFISLTVAEQKHSIISSPVYIFADENPNRNTVPSL